MSCQRSPGNPEGLRRLSKVRCWCLEFLFFPVCARHKDDRKAAKESIASATAQREKEAEAFAGESSELKANIAASLQGGVDRARRSEMF